MALTSGEKSSFNFYRVLRTIWQHAGVSRTDLAKRHRLDKTTVTHIVSDLVERGLVDTVTTHTETGRPGRRPEGLSINDDWGYVGGFELRADGIVSCAVNMHGRILFTDHVKLGVNRNNLSEGLFRQLDLVQSQRVLAGRPLIGIGVGLSGIVDREADRILHSIPLGIFSEPYEVTGEISGKVAVPCLVDNDANCCAWGVLARRRHERLKNYLYVLGKIRGSIEGSTYASHIGVGLGLVLDGQVYYGDDGSAGEFRSVDWHPSNASQFSLDDDEIAVIPGDTEATKRMLHELSRHVGLFVNTLNIKRVFVGGDFVHLREYFTPILDEEIQRNWPYEERVDSRIIYSDLGECIVAAGAAGMVLEHIFAEPLLPKGLRRKKAIWAQIFRERALHESTDSAPVVDRERNN